MARLRFKLEDRSDDLADFNDFTDFSGVLVDCLRRIYRMNHPGPGKLPKFAIVDLEVGSAVVGLEGDAQSVGGLVDAIVKIRNGMLPQLFTFDDVRAFQKLAKPLDNSTSAIEIQAIPIDADFVRGCRNLLDSATESIGEAIGSLDGLNVHARNYFRLYPEGQDRGVECSFDAELFDQVQSAIKKRVLVRGRVIRDPNGVTIHRIPHVDAIEIMPPLDQMPPITDLFGLFEKTPISFNSASDEWG